MARLDDLRRELERAVAEARRQAAQAQAPQATQPSTPSLEGPAAAPHVSAADDSRDLPLIPAKRLAIVTCMDTRVLVEKALNLRAGEAHILRNAGGLVTDDVLRSLAVSHHLLGIEQIIVMGHTDCGLGRFSELELRARVSAGAKPGARVPAAFGAFNNLDENVREQMRRLRDSGLFSNALRVRGFVYDLKTGRLNEITLQTATSSKTSFAPTPASATTQRVHGRLQRERLVRMTPAPRAMPTGTAATAPEQHQATSESFRQRVAILERGEAPPLDTLSSARLDLGLNESPPPVETSATRLRPSDLLRALVFGQALGPAKGRSRDRT